MNFTQYTLGLGASFLLLTACGGDDDMPVTPDNPNATVYEETTVEVLGGTGNTTLVTVRDRGEGTGTVTWTSDKTYQLDGLVFVNDGQVLTIEPGTVVRGATGDGENSSALIVARGARIEANGTADRPIVLTNELDNSFSTPDGLVQGTNLGNGLDLSKDSRWGGLIVLGRAGLNSSPGESAIEGIVTSEARGLYGGNVDDDNSGTLRYVSIRYGGTDIGGGNEINGFTLGGVGSGTTIDYVEVFANVDDGVEFFGGTAEAKHLVSAYCQDDAFDYDEGYRGKGQFWLAYQVTTADRGGEHDGGTDPETAEPFATPTIANASYFGLGQDGGKRLLTFRDNAGGKYYNSVFSGYAKGVDVEFVGAGQQDSYAQLRAGNLVFAHNLLTDIGGTPFVIAGVSDEVTVPDSLQAFASTYFSNNNNTSATDPGFGADGVTPAAGGAAEADLFKGLSGDGFFESVGYKGAVNPATGPTWITGWTRLSQVLN